MSTLAEPRRSKDIAVLVSTGLHAALLAALILLVTPPKLQAPHPRVVDVDIITEQQFRTAVNRPPVPAAAPLKPPPVALSSPVPKSSGAGAPSTIKAAATSDASSMTSATQFFTSRILDDPKNRQIKQTLPRLGPDERIIQLCNIEGLEQLRLAWAGKVPDSLDPSAMAETTIGGDTLVAPGGAYRLRKKWYAVSFVCTVGGDRESVVDFKYKLGSAIPRDQWDSHNLINEDIELD